MQSNESPVPPDHRKVPGLAIAGFIFGLTIYGFFLALIFGFIALDKIRGHPDLYKGRGWAIASIVLGLRPIIILLLFVIL